jgi:hypothetical protein
MLNGMRVWRFQVVRVSLIAETVQNANGLPIRSHHSEAVSVREEKAEEGGVAVPAMRGRVCGWLLRHAALAVLLDRGCATLPRESG